MADIQHCYCKSSETEQYMLLCQQCKTRFHFGCLRNGKPSDLMGDTHFKFFCQTCSTTGSEITIRLKLQWIQVIMLALYNLQLESGGKCGFFRWKEHICSFVDKHWCQLFINKKKTNTWRGTVAGTLSAGCPRFFKSGLADLGEPGWWALAIPNVPDAFSAVSRRGLKRKAEKSEKEEDLCQGLRQRTRKNPIQAAMELKERRSRMVEAKDIRKALAEAMVRVEEPTVIPPAPSYQDAGQSDKFRLSHHDDSFITNIKSEPPDAIFSDCSSPSVDWNDFEVKSENPPNDPIKVDPEEIVLGCNWDIGNEEVFEQTISSDDIDITKDTGPDISFLLDPVSIGGVKKELQDGSIGCSQGFEKTSKALKPLKARNLPEVHIKIEAEQYNPNLAEDVKQEFQSMSEYDEIQLLKQLNSLSNVLDENKSAKRLQRKLIVRQNLRAMNKPIFDMEQQYKFLVRGDSLETQALQVKQQRSKHFSFLDRFQVVCPSAQGRSHTKFVTRLLGFDDDQLESIISPYTMRTLKPFIFRDYESTPPRLKLLREIQEYPFRKTNSPCPVFSRYPIDYCYVKPHHIPVVNSLCREFFWPGIDLSECLQYPDFSVIAMYRKAVIGFAFMVPDVKYNEAYISFIFTHPEWRKAGIAKFMIYHLIQTCMGKDVTLHVSITNPACFLYHKFGFKVEETLLNFYDKYLPVNSSECRHALFLRLNR